MEVKKERYRLNLSLSSRLRATNTNLYKLYGIEELYRSNYKTWTYIRDRDTQGAIAWVQESMQDCIDGKHQIYYSNEFV